MKKRLGKKAQQDTEDVLWVIFELILLAMAGFSMWYYSYQKIEKNNFEEQFLARDIALTVDAMQASPHNLRYFYSFPDKKYDIIFSRKDENRVIALSKKDKFGFYPFLTIQENIAENTFELSKEKKNFFLLSNAKDDFDISDKEPDKNLLYIPEEKIEFEIPKEVLLDPIYYAPAQNLILDEINYLPIDPIPDLLKQRSEMNAAIANRMYLGLTGSGYTVLNTREDTKTGELLSILDEKRKDENIILAFQEMSNFIIAIDSTLSDKNIIKIFYHFNSKKSKAIGIKILNKLSKDKELKLDGVSLVPIHPEDEERYNLLDKNKISILIEINNYIDNKGKLSLNEKSSNIGTLILEAITDE